MSGENHRKEAPVALTFPEAHELSQTLVGGIERVIIGQTRFVQLLVCTLLSKGHLLIEGVPGVGKTVAARATAYSIEGTKDRRIQVTADMRPNDLIGSWVFVKDESKWAFIKGPVFTNILVADEINRGMPKLQAALLECMAEGQVTLRDGTKETLERLFYVMATQNPREHEGTYPLGEAALDRFLMKLYLGYPETVDDELKIAEAQEFKHPLAEIEDDPVITKQQVLDIRDFVPDVPLGGEPKDMKRYVTELIRATRDTEMNPEVALGVSTRNTPRFIRAAKAWALITGREQVTCDVVEELLRPIFRPRIVYTDEIYTSAMEEEALKTIVSRILEGVERPPYRS